MTANHMETEKKHVMASFEALHNLLMELEQKLEEHSRGSYLHSLGSLAKPYINDFDRGQLFATLQHELRVAEGAVFQARTHVARVHREVFINKPV